jgi:type I restriction enzyme S subunit
MNAYLPYAQYKPSNVDWLGDVPEHWKVWKVTHGFNRIGSGTTPRSDNPAFYDGDIPWVTTSELRESIILDTAQKVTEDAVSSHSALKLYPEGSLAIAMYGATIGRLGMLGVDATFNQACCVFSDPTVFDTRFFYYWLWMRRPILISLSNGGGQPNLSQDDLKKLWIPVPDIDEQQAIARFLDFKTAQIDALIAKKKTLLEKLAEKRTALISHAVTKGLDPSVPMKDSGVEWLGEIPAHWCISKLSYAAESMQTGPFGSQLHAEEYIEGGVPLINPVDISNGRIFDNPKITVGEDVVERLARHKLAVGDIVIARRGEMGRAGLVEESNVGWLCGTGSLRARLDQKILAPEFLLYQFNMKGVVEYLSLQSVGSTMDNLNTSILGRLPVVTPPIVEQTEVISYLHGVCGALDRQVEKVNQAIASLSEYRSALITNAVTGKIDVRDFKIPDLSAKELCDA